MQLPVDLLGQRATDALGRGELVHARGLQPAQAAEAGEQPLAALPANSRDVLERGAASRPPPARAMTLDGEPVRLVADLLDEVQRGRIWAWDHGLGAARHDELLLTGPARLPLG